jgi:mannitol-1-phosphate 5-dehydrogenase
VTAAQASVEPSVQPQQSGRTFVGFGFGAIQTGLFLLEAQASHAFARLVVAEVLPEVVASVRASGGYVTVNVAHRDHIEPVRVGPVEIYDPNQRADRAALVDAIATAHELATAVPSVRFYLADGAGSLVRLLAAGFKRKLEAGGPKAVLYAAENHNHAAEILREAIVVELNDPAPLQQVAFCNTVIGKMSGAPELAGGQPLAPMTPDASRAFLVEAFNRILISPARLPTGEPVARGIGVFVEKPDLLPFEEAKLYVHNALHAMAAYLGAAAGLTLMSQLPERPAILAHTRAAVLEESGAALVQCHAGIDPLFTAPGMAAYADDLFVRMVNPFLADRIDRVGRDPQRKLAWDDRLVGAMRVALSAQIVPSRLAMGAAAALEHWRPGAVASVELPTLWQRPNADAEMVATLCALIDAAQLSLKQWRAQGFGPIDPPSNRSTAHVAFPSKGTPK